MNFIFSLRSELLKLKRTSIIYLMLITAFIVPFVLVFDHGSPDPNYPPNGWDNYYREGFMVFAFVFVPFFFLLTSTLLMQIEVRNHAWKQILASPQSLFQILFSKFIILQLLAMAFLFIFNVYMIMGYALLDLIYDVGFSVYLKGWSEMLQLNLLALGSAVGISALSFWLALRFSNFIAPIAIGMLLWLIGPTAALELKWPYFDMYVFVLPFTIVVKRFENDRLFYQLLSFGYGVFFFLFAYLEFALKRVEWKSLFIKQSLPCE